MKLCCTDLSPITYDKQPLAATQQALASGQLLADVPDVSVPDAPAEAQGRAAAPSSAQHVVKTAPETAKAVQALGER